MLSKAKIAAAKGEVDYKVVKSLRAEVNDLLVKKSQMWQQHSRALFLKCGDHNTSYFHSKASHRFRRNRISGLRNSSIAWCTEDSQIKDITYDYYHSLFTLSHPTKFSKVMQVVKPTITVEMNAELLKPFLKDEVESALKQMEPITALGPDSMPPIFLSIFLVFDW